MRRLLSVAAIVAALVVFSATPAMAHGEKHGGAQKSNRAVCTVESCPLTGLHKHNGITCVAHYYGDGHTYHKYCEREDCALVGYHAHDGVYCFGHTKNDGHDYHHTRKGRH